MTEPTGGAGEEAAGKRSWAGDALFAGPGEMRARCRAHDWARTPLGPPHGWSRSLRAVAGLVLASRQPMFLWWGAALTQLYNDGYVASLGDDFHPRALGAPGRECFAELWPAIGPEVETILAGGAATWHDDRRVPIRRGGRIVDAYWSYGFTPVTDDDGRVAGVLVTGAETTPEVARRRVRERELEARTAEAEEARRRAEESERRFRETADAAPVMMWSSGLDARCDWFSRPWLAFTGRPIEAELGDGWAERVHPDDLARCLATYRGAFDARRPFTMEYRLQRHDGEYRWLLDNAVPRHVGEGEGAAERTFVGYIGTCIDVTDQRCALEAAEMANVQLQEQAIELEAANQQLQDVAAELEMQTSALEALSATLAERADELGRARDAIEAEREVLGRVVAQLPAAVAVMEGPELRFRAMSAAYRQIIGGREVLGQPIRTALPELSGGENGADFFALLEGVYRTGETVVGTEVLAAWDDDDDGVPEDHVVDLVYAPLRAAAASDDGPAPVEGVVALVLDVTARARAEAAVRESEARFRAIADATPVMLWVTEADGACTFLNRTWLDFTGQTLAEGLGFGWLGAVHPDDAAATERAFREAAGVGAPFRADYRLRRPDGSYRQVTDAAAPRLGAHGEFVGYVGSVVDVEERASLLEAEQRARREAERARAAAEAASRAKSEFLAVMSHELRTPLNAIDGYAELMELGIRGPLTEQQRQDLGRIRTSQRHLLGLINGVLNYSRIEAGAVRYAVEEVSVDETLATCEALAAPMARARGLALRFGGCDPRLRVRGDREKVQQVVLNLLSNAVKFTEPGGRVELACDEQGDRVAISVLDTGSGVPANRREEIFEPFVQIDASRTRTQEGVGLGLTISRDLARGMGGDLTLESTPGVGSVFTLTLPRA